MPAYSPNLNIIERLWKFMRKKIINTMFYRKNELFRKAVLSFFENISHYKDELAALPTLNFHIRKLQNNS
ncbi:MAG: transposase [Bacteroidetes bacterium]|nr:transposase [Bacteroidota bacterium]